MSHNRENLINHIVPLSESTKFNVARKEWKLVNVEIRTHHTKCPCGVRIKEVCYVENQLNGYITFVGNQCINQFLGISTGNLFAGLKRIIVDNKSRPNEDLIIHAYKLGYLYGEKEYNFLMDIKRKRNLSDAQLSWLKKINRRIVNRIEVD